MDRPLWPSSSEVQLAPGSCWSRRQLIKRSHAWFGALPRALRFELFDQAVALAGAAFPFDRWRELAVPPGLAALGARIRRQLMEGSGVAFLTDLSPPGAAITDDVLRWAYLLLGAQIGLPLGPRGSLVEISGPCRAASLPADDAGPETTFHTDSAAGETPDVVGMLCLTPPCAGGEQQIASATLAHELLRARDADLLRELYEPLPRDGGAAEPVFRTERQRLRLHYLRASIEAAAGGRLRARQREALDRLDQVLNHPLARVQLAMRRADMLFINNGAVAHNRRPFVEDPSPARRRRMVRLWLSTSPGPA
jgi:hypothetical protein